MLIIAWETTSACNLQCCYCRASAKETPHPDELTSEEAKDFIDSVASLKPMIILSGGEPLLRPDIFQLAERATKLGMRVALATNGTLLTPQIVDMINEANISRVSVSMDGASSEVHDVSRGSGAFIKTLQGIEFLRGKVPFQINMTITKSNVDQVGSMMDLAEDLGAVAFHLFFLVPTGRGQEDDLISPSEQDAVLRWLVQDCKSRSIEVKVTCAPQYSRIMRVELSGEERQKMLGSACLAGTNFVFVSKTGDVCPCGYLPVVAGNVREQSFVDIWNNSTIFKDLRDKNLQGKCGQCSYSRICGGCRARAYAYTGDYMAADPLCDYQVV